MNNPFAKHTNNLFATRDSVDEAVQYVNDMLAALPSDHRLGVSTAVMVLINTASVVFAFKEEPSPEKLILEKLIDERVMEILGREESVEDQINTWARNELDDRIQDWMNDNIDIEEQIQEKLENASFRIEL